MIRAAAVVTLAALVGCGSDDGPLDADTVAGLVRTPGSAEGYARTGLYDATLLPESCDCPAVTGMTLCLLAAVPEAFASLDIVQSDGSLVVPIEIYELVGPLQDDGTFTVGAVDDLTNALVDGRHIARFDGEFAEDGGFAGDFAHRYQATFIDTMLEEREVDCTERFTVEAVRR